MLLVASEGSVLHALALDRMTGDLRVEASQALPEIVQYVAIDRRRGLLYVSVSDRAARHQIHVLRFDAATGALTSHGAPVVLPDERAIHVCLDGAGEHLLLAQPRIGRVSVLGLKSDGTLGDFLPLPEPVETGYFAHQALLDPSGRGLVTCALGWDARDDEPERLGELRSFCYDRGALRETARHVPGAGLGPRHLDYAHGRAYVAVERGNRLAVFAYAEGVLGPRHFDVATLADPSNVRPSQRAGAIHFHSNGRWLYVSNRANATVERGGARVFAGGENNLALFHVDPATGEPRTAGHFDTGGIEPRTFTIDPAGELLAVANHSALDVDDGGRVRHVPRSWVVFRIGAQGALERLATHERRRGELNWIGAV